MVAFGYRGCRYRTKVVTQRYGSDQGVSGLLLDPNGVQQLRAAELIRTRGPRHVYKTNLQSSTLPNVLLLRYDGKGSSNEPRQNTF